MLFSASSTPSKTKKQKRPKEVDVRDILTNKNMSRNDMRKTIVDLTGSVANKGITKEYLNKKLKAKYSPREKQIRLEVNKAKMETILNDRAVAWKRMDDSDDDQMGDLHKQEYVALSHMFTTF